MLYKHFGSKKGLSLAVLRELGRQSLDVLQEGFESIRRYCGFV
jgi:hypothetical protein